MVRGLKKLRWAEFELMVYVLEIWYHCVLLTSAGFSRSFYFRLSEIRAFPCTFLLGNCVWKLFHIRFSFVIDSVLT